jgi:DegV family protein with EDD domain
MDTRSRVRIVTDTTAVLDLGYAKSRSIEVVPQVVVFDDVSFKEDYELSYDEFIRRLKTTRQLPKTAAPEPGWMMDAYRKQLAHAKTIISIHPSAEVSGTVRSAMVAKTEAFPDEDIRIIDSRVIGGPLAAMVMEANDMAEKHASADEIVARVNYMVPRVRAYFLVSTLEYLQKGGRIGGASALIGSALQIKPILQVKNGRVEQYERVRTFQQALGRLEQIVADECPRSGQAHLCVMHADDFRGAQHLAGDLMSMLNVTEIPIYGLGAAITTHAGPGTLAVGFFVD